ncbi:MAG: hydantoinase/oxoprolinase family protein [Thalassobaculum sp.]|uniref:hydantoinase/oxoprolinase family protein n=1 Tax=Thalassobaculum sp. TaxID=2022740 RepID=UPI0032EF8CAF
MSYRIAVDVGGTFTDLVAVDGDGKVTFVKAASTPEDQAIGFMDGLDRLSEAVGLPLADLLAQTDQVLHGMTVATNALLERKGAKVGLLTTQGHRDVLEMREGLKPERYNLRLARQAPLVPRHLRFGVRERMRADGRVETPLDRASLDAAIAGLKAEGVGAVAVAYLHSYRNDAHERETLAAIREAMPGVNVSLSSDVLPQIKEYERVSTTVVNAYVAPLIKGYLEGLERRLKRAGFAGPLLIIFSHGGVAPVGEAVRIAAGTVLSGPAGGLAGGRRIAEMMQAPDLITFDVGGTSTDISMIMNGEVVLSSNRTMANERIAMPSLDIVTLGAGGGSIARPVAGGLLTVGPESAGSRPGPICYGRGGTSPTVTDASVVLGFLDPDNFAGGRSRLDRDAALAAFGELGAALGVDALAAAEGVHRVMNTQMAEGIRAVTVRRGVDPRRFGLLGFGGAAGLHVTELARMLGMKRVVVPRMASVLSAWGMLTTALRLEAVQSFLGEADTLDVDAVDALYARMAGDGRARMETWFDGEIVARRSADMRYGEQVFEIDVALGDIDLKAPDAMAKLKRAFEARHDELYAYSLPEQQPVLVNARVATVGVLPGLPGEPTVEDRRPAAPKGRREVYLGGWTAAEVYAFPELAAGQALEGPALVESETTTVLLRAGDRATATVHGWLDIAVREG